MSVTTLLNICDILRNNIGVVSSSSLGHISDLASASPIKIPSDGLSTISSEDPVHSIMPSSTWEFGEKEARNLKGETLGGFDVLSIQEYEDLQVEPADVDSLDKRLRKRFVNWTRVNSNDNVLSFLSLFVTMIAQFSFSLSSHYMAGTGP
ncbi:hypothetical protein JVT61DRAFT_10734 [Boletus reticuloceps]|uniref:Uncharacterized protein n=1 Tax=Boletus reticuloceps TaxID=495285 RepID=A0A8I3A5H0_9AGAM|nr:hypothetical protein JVT61DRAFT_10734 [Boletus reticuloceps]